MYHRPNSCKHISRNMVLMLTGGENLKARLFKGNVIGLVIYVLFVFALYNYTP